MIVRTWGRSAVLLGFFLFPTVNWASASFESLMSAHIAGCPTMGSATQNALAKISRTRQLIVELKDKCQGLAPLAGALNDLQSQIQRLATPNALDARVLNAQGLVNELEHASVDLATTPNPYAPALASSISDALVSARLELISAIAARKTQAGYNETLREFGVLPEMLSLLDNLATQVPALRECEGKEPNKTAEIAGTLLPIFAGLGSPVFGVATAAAGNLVKSLSQFLTQDWYSRYIKKFDEIQKQQTLNCVLESLQFSRCDLNDSLKLLNWQFPKSSKGVQSVNTASGIDVWKGYDLLIFDMPILASWTQRTRIGQPPTTKEDATYKRETQAIEGEYEDVANEFSWRLKQANEDIGQGAAQRPIGLSLLLRLLQRVSAAPSEQNIFTRVVPYEELGYFLINRKYEELKIPGQENITGYSLIIHDANKGKIPADLVGTIQAQSKILIKGDGALLGGAEAELDKLLSRRKVEDALNLIKSIFNKAESPEISPYIVLYDLRQWLQAIRNHPEKMLEIFANDPNPNSAVRANMDVIDDTIARLTRSLNYADSGRLGPDVVDLSPLDRISRISVELNVRKSGDRFLVERLADFVQLFLQNEIRNPATDKEVRAILEASSQALLDRLVTVGNRGKDLVEADIEGAHVLTGDHLQRIWEGFHSTYVNQLKQMKAEFSKNEKAQLETDPLKVKVYSRICARLLAFQDSPRDKDIRAYCAKTEIKSGHLNGTGVPPDWKKRLELKFDEAIVLPPVQRECLYRNFFRDSLIYEEIKDPSKGRTAPRRFDALSLF